MKGRTRPPLGFPGDTAGPRGFTVAADSDAAQVTLRGPATGAGGGAYLRPAPGVELAFDRVGGWLSSVTVMGAKVTGEAVSWIVDVFGPAAAAVIRDPPPGGIRCLALRTSPRTLGVLSRLAQLDAARVTSPVPGSRLWAAEATDLARQARLMPPDWVLRAEAAPAAVPDGFVATIPAAVLRLTTDEGPGSRRCVRPGTGPGDGRRRLERSLDPGLVPPGMFQPGLWPGADLAVRVHQNGAPLITVEAMLLPGVTAADLADCRARLVDSDGRRVLATAAFRVCGPSRAGAPWHARAELPASSGLRAPARSRPAWVEVADDERRPVDGTTLRRIRRALRWADAALRAESRPNGLAPELTDEQWIRLAALAWDRCRADWVAAGDPQRAAQATLRSAARAAAAGRARPFLAELAGGA